MVDEKYKLLIRVFNTSSPSVKLGEFRQSPFYLLNAYLWVTIDISAKNISSFCQNKVKEKDIIVLYQAQNVFLYML